MPLTFGTKLGPYEIQSPLGAGGMGEVYRARDTRLDRTVAVKVLASHLSSSPELKQRMEREARSISALNHPHICQLYDIGSQNGADYLVMEFLEGQTLAERLRKGPLPLAELLRIAISVAEALAVAHRQGIVHRDLKPGNIMLTQAGAKLMDFGLAKPIGPPNSASSTGSGSSSPPSFTAAATMSGPSPLTPLTTAGTIVGTIQYMSPEQIEGKEADARSDIFAFGGVLYEMITGKRPFSGKSQISLASAILESDPPAASSLNPLTPPAYEHVIVTCLQKNPDDRYLAAHDIKIELQWIASPSSRLPASAPTEVSAHSPRRERLAWAAALVITILLGALAGFFLNRPTPALSIRTLITAPPGARLALTGDFAGPPILSPDGSALAFTASAGDGKLALWVRSMDALDAHVLAGTNGATFPFWSPDSRSLGFFADNKLKTVNANGSSVTTVCDAPFGRGGAWSSSGEIVFSPLVQAALVKVPATGGTPAPLTQLSPQHTSHRWPFLLPDGRHVLYLALNHDPALSANNAIYYASLDGRENKLLLHADSNAVYSSRYLLFARGNQLMAQPFDPGSGKLSGEAQPLADGVVNDASTWHMDASASNSGLLVLGSGGSAEWQLVWMDRSGKLIGVATDKLTNLQGAAISPQGDRIAFGVDVGINDLWVLDLARSVRTRLTFGPVQNNGAVWSPDGKWIAYNSGRNGQAQIYRKPADGSGAEELLLSDHQVISPLDWSHDRNTMLFGRGPLGSFELWALPLNGEGAGKPHLVLARPANSDIRYARLSPDQHWLAYSSNESGVFEIYAIPYPSGAGKWQVSPGQGVNPRWSPDGRQLYYFNPALRAVMAVQVTASNGALQFSAPQQLALSPASAMEGFYDVTPDGKKILLDQISQQVSQSITVITNFPAALKK
jgi:serine/threonine protein kinase/Tol biopolymer transport system component